MRLPLLPIKNNVLFPYLMMPLSIGRPASVAAVEAAMARQDKSLLVVTQKSPDIEDPGLEDLYPIGTQAVIQKVQPLDEVLQVLVEGSERAQVLDLKKKGAHWEAEIQILTPPRDLSPEVEALHRTLIDAANQIMELVDPPIKDVLGRILSNVKEPLHLVYLLSSMFPLETEQEQALLAVNSRLEALRLMHGYLQHELQVLKVRQQIASHVQSELSEDQKNYLLRQQLRAIQEELGEQTPEQADGAELRKRLDEADLPEEVRKEAERELVRMERMSSSAPDYQLTRTYLELVIELPWRKTTADNIDLDYARRVLDEDHYDLQDIKERIIEFLAVLKLNPEAKAPILCFVGPPGVGKTSLGQSIARAIGRKFERMSLGGLHDEAELRGHRRTYIGAMPGRILQAIRRAEVRNPLLMLDEVDKLARDFHGDPAAALLEILDPAQNHKFHDNYLDLPFDLTKVFFITTCNTLDTVPQPLIDRMEVLRLAGYSEEEKKHIARQYLIPRQLKEAGLHEEWLTLPEATLARVIRRYTREAGVRELERTIGRICRKVATRFAAGQVQPVDVTVDKLGEMLGPEHFFEEEARQALSPGVAAGLAWTQAGGEVLYVEAVLLPQGKDLTLTGQLGEVMKESARAAQSYIASRADELGVDPEKMRAGVHIHVPAGATPKDGPSAGVALATALLSLYTGRPVRSDTAMTGEITLSGLVFPVGGIKEKILAAHRAGIRRVVLPRENEKELVEVPEHVLAALELVFAQTVTDVFQAAITEYQTPGTCVHEPLRQSA